MLVDFVQDALDIVGVNDVNVSKWLGKPCNCDERREKLRQLEAWAARIIKGKIDRAREFLNQITSH